MENKTVKLDDAPLNSFHIKVASQALGAHLADGYAIGTIGVALAFIQPQWGLSSVWVGLLGAAALIGLFFGSLIIGRLSDKMGRKKLFIFNFILITIASILQIFVDSPMELFICRVLIGFGLGGDYSVAVALLAEFSPRKYRGAFLGGLSVIWTFGYVASTAVGYFMLNGVGANSDNWKLVLGTSAIPALIILLWRLGSPESPRWLVNVGRVEEARAIVKKYIGPNVELDDEKPAPAVPYSALFSKAVRKRTAFSSIFFAVAVLPYFAIYTFLPIILTSMGLKETLKADFLLNIVLIVGALVGVYLTEALTRRHFAIWTFAIMTVCLFALSILPTSSIVLMVVAFAIFTFTLSANNNLTGIFPAESFPTEMRTSGVGFATAVSRIAAATSTFLLPISLSSLGLGPTMFALAICVLLGTIAMILWAPETKDLTLVDASDTVSNLAYKNL